MPPPPEGELRGIADSRRIWNARATSLGMTLLGAGTGLFLYLDGAPSVVVALIAAAALGTGVAYGLALRGHATASVLLVVLVILAEQLLIVASSGELAGTPFFATLVVLVAATGLSARWTAIVYGLAFATVCGEAYLGGVFPGGDPLARGLFVGALVLLTMSAVVSLVYARGMENAFALVTRRDAEKRALAERLQKVERMEALGRLAGGVAHDFNNLLVVIQGSADLALGELPEDHPAARELRHVLEAGDRAAALTRQLLAFSRKQVVPTTLVDPFETLEGLRELVPRLVGEKVRVRFELRPSDDRILASSTQLEQVVLNLAANARDAMPEGGTLTIALGRRFLGDGEVAALPGGAYVELAVTDTGTGISREARRHLFEPFYTTKDSGRGTGLGLATCFGIASQAGGAITAESEPGRGSTFRVLFPLAEEGGVHGALGSGELEAGKGAKVLVVDDDPTVRRIVRRFLERCGCAVIEASDAESCLAAARAHAGIDCILTDVVLGTADGIAILADLHALHPNARLVVMSGYTPDPERAAKLAQEGATFLSKPFSQTELLVATGLRGADAPALDPVPAPA